MKKHYASNQKLRMVLVGGDLHQEMVAQSDALKKLQADQAAGLVPTEATLRFGHIYRKRDGSQHVFLGRVKQPNASKFSFAFAQLPEPPTAWDDVDLDEEESYRGKYFIDRAREERAVAQKWESVSWEERCQWDWYASKEWLQRWYASQVKPGYYHCPADIVLMSSPKFEADVGEALSLARQLRENVGAEHKYVNGHGEDLAEVRRVTRRQYQQEPQWEES